MRMIDLIEQKKHGDALSEEALRWIVRGCTDQTIPDYQLSALMMAICFQGMNEEETAILTDAMAHSGDCIDLSDLGDETVDKHSTGGVGDKTTLIISPIVAAAGGRVAKMSGRGLGFTGGTIDKLESIPGYRTTLSPEEFQAQVNRIGIAVVGQTGQLAPADKKLYALRDVTATVDCMPLIAASVMSKKIAAGARSIVLDVKTGRGAFMKTQADSEALAQRMVAIGRHCGRRMCALITDMDAPLGKAIGNAPEVREAAEILQGGGDPSLRAVCVELATQMLSLSLQIPESDARTKAEQALYSGKAFERMQQWVVAQGGDANVLAHPERLPQARIVRALRCESEGWLYTLDAQRIGEAAGLLGTARLRTGDPVDPAAGIILHCKPGDYCRPGDVLAVFHTSSEDRIDAAVQRFRSAMQLSEQAPTLRPVILSTIR